MIKDHIFLLFLGAIGSFAHLQVVVTVVVDTASIGDSSSVNDVLSFIL